MAKKILLVDDSMVSRRIIANQLKQLGFEVEMAKNGPEGLQKAKEVVPDLMLIDLEMPDMDGFEVIKQKLEVPEIADIPYIALAARMTEEDLKEVDNLGITFYTFKPVDPEELKKKIEDCLLDKKRREKLRLNKNFSLPEGKKDPIQVLKVKCPICRYTNIISYTLKAKSQKVISTYFQVADYLEQSPFIKSEFLNHAVTLCPKCLYASDDKASFIGQEKGFPTTIPRFHKYIKSAQEEREKIIEDAYGFKLSIEELSKVFERPRSFDEAIITYDLALHCFIIEGNKSSKNLQPKEAACYLRKARLYCNAEMPEKEAAQLKMALDSYLEANNHEASIKVNYIIAMLYHHFGEDKKALQFIQEMRTEQTDFKEATEGNARVMALFKKKGQDLWDAIKDG